VVLDGVIERVRFIGMDTPERGDEPGFSQATDFVRQHISAAGDVVYLSRAPGVNDRDRYNRLLRCIHLDSAGTQLLNQMIVDQRLGILVPRWGRCQLLSDYSLGHAQPI